MRLCALALVLIGNPLHADVVLRLTPAVVKEAIAASQKGAGPTRDDYIIGDGANGAEPVVHVITPYARVLAAASEARRKYATPDPVALARDLASTEFEVSVAAYTPMGESMDAPIVSIEHVVLVSWSATWVESYQQPRVNKTTRTWSNAFGVTRQGHGIEAFFPLTALKAGREIRVVTTDREYRYFITPEFVAKIR